LVRLIDDLIPFELAVNNIRRSEAGNH
jgi:hypothetical protein